MASNSILWSIRVFMMLSLSLQVFLVLFAPIREKTANSLIHSLLSLACSMADGLVVGAMGFISFNQENSSTNAAEIDKTIHAFWASFLLLHFGGSDTIITFSPQNKSLWQQYLNRLIIQISATVYIFEQVFSNDKSFFIPTMLVLLAGVIKIVERCSALWNSTQHLQEGFFLQRKVSEKMLNEVDEDHEEGGGGGGEGGEEGGGGEGEEEEEEARLVESTVEGGGGGGGEGGGEEEARLVESTMVKHAFNLGGEEEGGGEGGGGEGEEEEEEEEARLVESTVEEGGGEGGGGGAEEGGGGGGGEEEARLVESTVEEGGGEGGGGGGAEEGGGGEEEARLVESTVVKHAYNFFLTCKIFIRDLILTRQQREMSQKYFRKVSAIDALRVMSVELHFMYELLYTKASIIQSVCGYIFRIIAFTSVVMAYVLFNRLKKHKLSEIDVKITYSLLYGEIALEVIALFMLAFFDWPISGMKCCKIGSSKLQSFHNLASPFNDLRKPRFATYGIKPNAYVTYEALDTPFIFRRWSESISTLRLLPQMLKMEPKKLRVYKNPLIKQLWIFIVKKLRDMDDPKKVKEILEAKGVPFLKSPPEGIEASYEINVLVWHFATEICYQRDKSQMTSAGTNDEMEFSKILSEYMMYILVKQPNVSSDVAGIVNVVYWEMLFELRDLMGTDLIRNLFTTLSKANSETMHQRPWLKKVIKLTEKMQCLENEKWRVMTEVWIEMLSYVAIHTKGRAHMSLLSKGGELITFVWLFMAHLGYVYKLELD